MPPLLRPRRTRDYVVRMPPDRWVKAACEQVRCENWRYGWDTILDERTPPGQELAAWIRSGAPGRDYREMRSADGDVTVFRFAAHQRCFTEHRTRPASWLVRAGQQVVGRHTGMSGWIDDLDQHVGRLAEQLQKGQGG
jgi:hypothetical protein